MIIRSKVEIVEAGGESPEIVVRGPYERRLRIPCTQDEARAAAARLFDTIEISFDLGGE